MASPSRGWQKAWGASDGKPSALLTSRIHNSEDDPQSAGIARWYAGCGKVTVHKGAPAQRSAAIKRRKEIWEALHPGETGTNCSTLGGRGNTSFAAETAAVSGGSKQDINRHLARAESLGDELEEIAGTRGAQLKPPLGGRQSLRGCRSRKPIAPARAENFPISVINQQMANPHLARYR
jgi:hypothetical protein